MAAASSPIGRLFVTRFAPSPTGLLHLGHAYAALTAHDAAQQAGGRFLLRIEDIDATRCRAEFEAAIRQDLSWLGLCWEEPVRRQSEHLADYHAALDRLKAEGLLYRDFRSRRDLAQAITSAPHDPARRGTGSPLAPAEEARLLEEGRPFAWRLSLARARERLGAGWKTLAFVEEGSGPNGEHGLVRARPELGGDVVLARKDVGVAYHLAVVLDDARQGVTHVIRGRDLFEACHVQRLLQALLHLPTPTYRHHPLLLDERGRRLAKRDGAPALRLLREQGVTPSEIRARVGLPASG